MTELLKAKNYKDFISSQLDSSRFGRGIRTKLADFLNLQLSYLSAALTGKHDLSLENGLKICDFFKLSETETEYYMLMHNRDVAGSVQLKKHYQNLLTRKSDEMMQIQNITIDSVNDLDDTIATKYSEYWYISPVHMCVLNEKTRTVDSIVEATQIGRKNVKHALDILVNINLVAYENYRYKPTVTRLHFNKKSKALRAHHCNWRINSVRKFDEQEEQDFLYTMVCSLDQEAHSKIREILLDSVSRFESTIKTAGDEQVSVIAIDFYKLTK